jgi:hypothetical protein
LPIPLALLLGHRKSSRRQTGRIGGRDKLVDLVQRRAPFSVSLCALIAAPQQAGATLRRPRAAQRHKLNTG